MGNVSEKVLRFLTKDRELWYCIRRCNESEKTVKPPSSLRYSLSNRKIVMEMKRCGGIELEGVKEGMQSFYPRKIMTKKS